MSSYSMTLRETLQTFMTFKGIQYSKLNTKQFIEEGRKVLLDFDYPIFDSEYRGVFETNLIRNFYMKEIGFETEELFKFQLESWLLINMPYFNKLFESELIKFDPLVNSNMNNEWKKTKDTDGKVDSNTKGDTSNTNKQKMDVTQNSDSFNRELESNTPDSRLSITTDNGKGVIQYASNIKEDDRKSNSSSINNVDANSTESSNITGNTLTDITETESYLQNRTGKIGSVTYSKMLKDYRETFIRIEKQIFDEMKQLFMLVY